MRPENQKSLLDQLVAFEQEITDPHKVNAMKKDFSVFTDFMDRFSSLYLTWTTTVHEMATILAPYSPEFKAARADFCERVNTMADNMDKIGDTFRISKNSSLALKFVNEMQKQNEAKKAAEPGVSFCQKGWLGKM